MVAVSSRLAVLVAFAWFAGVTGAPVQDTTSNDLSHRATHSDRAHKHSKPPVIPAPKGHKTAKGRSHKQLKEAHKRSAANMFASNPFAKMAAFAMNGPARRQGGSIFKRQQALLSASATRSHLGRRDHDHDHDHDHDDHHHHHHDEDDDDHHHDHDHHHHGRDFVRVKAGGKLDIAVSRRDESTKGATGTVVIMSGSTNSPDKTLASMCMEPAEGKLLLDACEKKQTEMKMVHVSSADPENNSDRAVQLQVPVYNKDYMLTQDYCATYDRDPPATGSPIEMRPCGEENQSKSQMFSFNPQTNELRPAKFSAANDASGIAQVKEDKGGLAQRADADSVQMKFVPTNVEIPESSSTSAGYTSTITATETSTSTATVTVSATPDTSSSSLMTDTSSSATTSTTVAPLASSTMPAALDIILETPSSSNAPSASSTSIEPSATSTSSTAAPTADVSATSTSVDAAAVASSIAVGGESSS